MAPKQKEKMKNPLVVSSSEEKEYGEETDSDSDSEPAVAAKPRPEISRSAAAGKRSSMNVDDKPKKKMKTEQVKKPSTTDEDVKMVSAEEPKKLFQRLFSEADEIAMLKGFLDFNSSKGDPYENMDSFCDYVKALIEFNATKAQIVTKLQRCKKKFVNMVVKGKSEDKIKYSKDFDQKAFELSRKIWGSEGLLPAKNNRVISAPKKEEEEEGRVVVTRLSLSRKIALFIKAENSSFIATDVSDIAAYWDMVPDGPKKRELEERFKKIKAMQAELCLQRIALINKLAKMLFKKNASSSN